MTLIIGIDISKKTSDWCVMSDKKNTESFKVGNNIDSLTKAIHKVAKKFGVEKSEMLICAENTGKYIYPLAVTCKAEGVFLWIENAYYISLYAKKQRGKNDSVDAFRIADYARKNQDDAKQFELPTETMARLRQLLHLQQDFDLLVSKYNAKIKDCESYMPDEVYQESCVYWRNISDNAREQSERIEEDIAKIIAEDKTLSRQDYLLQTIPGVGRKTSHVMIAATSGFTIFTDGRKFCCHAGVAPFSYESGTSIKSGTHISHRANMRLKCSVHIAAHIAASICKNGPIHEYYLRKIAEGKNKMVVLNNCRAKLITIMFAVIRDNTPFDPNHEYRAK